MDLLKRLREEAVKGIARGKRPLTAPRKDILPFQQQRRQLGQNLNTATRTAIKTASDPIKRYGEYLGKGIAAPFLEPQMQRQNQQLNQNVTSLLTRANRPGTDPETAKRLRLIAQNQARQSGQNANFLQQEYKATPLEIGSAGAGTALTILGGPKMFSRQGIATGAFTGATGGIVNKATGGSFSEGFGQGVGMTPQISGLTNLTSPFIQRMAVRFAPKVAPNLVKNPVGNYVTQSFIRGLGNIPEGAAIDVTLNRRPLGISSAALDFATGLLPGSPNARSVTDTGQVANLKGVNPKAFNLDEPSVKELEAIVDVMKTSKGRTKAQLYEAQEGLQNFLEAYAPGFKNAKNKDALKLVDAILDRRYKVDSPQTFPKMGFAADNGGKVKTNLTKILVGEGQGKERGFITTVKQGKNTPEQVKKIVQGTYVPKSGKELRATAREFIRQNPDEALNLAKNPQNDLHIQIGDELLNSFYAQGRNKEAAALAQQMAESGTEFGRAVQAFANYDKTTPAGAVRFAQTAINKYNKANPGKKLAITDKQVQSLFNRATKIQKMPEGRKRNIASYQLMEEINNLIPSSIADKAVTVWKAGLLTSLRTQERNILGNAMHGVGEVLKDIPASIADRAMALRTGQRSTAFTLKGVRTGFGEGVGNAKDLLVKGYDPDKMVTKYDYNRITWGNNKVEKALKVYTEAVFRSLGASDKPFWQAAYNRSLASQALVKIRSTGKGNVDDLVKNATTEMKGQAVKEANMATFKNVNELTKLARNVSKVKVKGIPVGQIVAPFTGVPSSIAGQIISYSPAGLINGIAKAGKVIIKGTDLPFYQREAAQEIGRGVIGTGLIGLGAYLTAQGLMTGQPKDAKERQQWYLEGKQPNSVLIGGQWRSINSIGPEALVILAGSKLQQEFGEGGEGNLGRFGGNIGKDILSQSFLQGVQGPLEAIQDPERYGKGYVGQQLSSYVPNLIKDTGRATDPFMRENNSVFDPTTNSIPGLRNQGLVRRDVFGNPIKQEPSGIGAYIDVFNSKTPVKNDLVIDELARLNNAGFNATPAELKKDQTINGQKIALSPEQLNNLTAISGPQVYQGLSELVQNSSYQSLSDEEKQKAIGDMVTTVRKRVKANFSINDIAPEESIFEESPEAPKDLWGRLGLGAQAIFVDPGNTVKAIFTEERMRKIEGNALILERKQYINNLDDKNLHVDHIIPLGMGGDNSPENLQVMTVAEKAKKDKLEKQLIYKLQNNEITRQEAQKQIRAFNEANPNGVPYTELSMEKQQTLAEKVPSTGSLIDNKIEYISEDGDTKTINLNPPTKGAGIDAFVNSDWNITKAREVWKVKDSLTPEDFESALQTLGVEKEDVRYDYLANHNNDIKTQYIISKNMTHDELLERLTTGRVISISGDLFASNGVIDNLVDEGLITEAEGKYLKKLKLGKDGEPAKGSGGKGKVKKVKFIKPDFVSSTVGNISPEIGKIDTSLGSFGIETPNLNFQVPSLGYNNNQGIPALPNFRVKFNL